ncbi:glutamate-5-semialdehyde dehydrogenase [Aerococcaceae bacterium DSM 111021]|nr:glutamate-5-semialdehyde dehydrogenase [Aerococcaceae bacterium DSM 111021]
MTEQWDDYLIELGKKAKGAAKTLRRATEVEKNEALLKMADAVVKNQALIIEANQKDLERGKENGLTDALLERLTLTEQRVESMANGLRQMAALPDPTLITEKQWVNKDGLKISRQRVPLGVIGIIYESRPNVTVDATGLCLKAGNAIILRGGKEALESNQAIVQILQKALEGTALSTESVQLIMNPSRELAAQFMRLNQYVDCLIPRGGAGLINAVMRQATVPVIETGVGNCHLYIHEAADIDKALAILINGKTQRNSVCNALESLVIDEAIAKTDLPKLIESLKEYQVEIRGDEKAKTIVPTIEEATEEDYSTEFLDSIIAVKVVANYDDAIQHIETYSTGHSDAVITEDYTIAKSFLNDVDSAVVYVNASTRFTDGEMFGFGGEMGISTQKLHARGPMGLEELTSYKYTVEGTGQIRE